MRRTTVTLPDDVHQALTDYQRDQEVRLPLSALVQAAMREYLARRGYAAPSFAAAFGITPAPRGSGAGDASAAHDRYVAEAAAGR